MLCSSHARQSCGCKGTRKSIPQPVLRTTLIRKDFFFDQNQLFAAGTRKYCTVGMSCMKRSNYWQRTAHYMRLDNQGGLNANAHEFIKNRICDNWWVILNYIAEIEGCTNLFSVLPCGKLWHASKKNMLMFGCSHNLYYLCGTKGKGGAEKVPPFVIFQCRTQYDRCQED